MGVALGKRFCCSNGIARFNLSERGQNLLLARLAAIEGFAHGNIAIHDGEDDRQGRIALAQVHPAGLTEKLRATYPVPDVITHLTRYAHVEPVTLGSFDTLGIDAGQVSAD